MAKSFSQRDIQLKINRLLRFFTREKASGFLVAVADDQRVISSINKELIVSAQQKNRKITIFFIDANLDLPILEQFRRAATDDVHGVIVGNLDTVFPKENLSYTQEPKQDLLTELNFGREALSRLGKPMLFWVTPDNFAILQRRAADLFTQRATSTVFFDIEQELEGQYSEDVEDIQPNRAILLDETEKQTTLDRVTLLLRQLHHAKKSKQSRRRIANDIALPLAEELAKLDDPEAVSLLEDYYDDFLLSDGRSLVRRAKVYLSLHRYDAAEPLLREAIAHMEQLSPSLALTEALESLGDLLAQTGEITEALDTFEQYLRVADILVLEQPDNSQAKYRLSVSYSKLGDTYINLGDLDKATAFFKKDIDLSENLYEAHPQNIDFKRGLAISYSKLGDVYTALGNLDKARSFFEKRIELVNELYEDDPQNLAVKRNLAISFSKLGNTYSALGDLDKALTFFEKDIELSRELCEAYPQNVDLKRALSVSYSQLGSTHRGLGNLDKARSFFEKDIELSKELHEAYPKNVDFKNELALSYQLLGQFFEKNMLQTEHAKVYYQASKKLLEDLVNSHPEYAEFKKNLEWVSEKLVRE